MIRTNARFIARMPLRRGFVLLLSLGAFALQACRTMAHPVACEAPSYVDENGRCVPPPPP